MRTKTGARKKTSGRRKMATSEGKTKYFAYGATMDPEAQRAWLRKSGGTRPLAAGRPVIARGVELVYNGLSKEWGGRVAGLEKKSDGMVHGLLFEVEQQQWPVVVEVEASKGCEQDELAVKVGAGAKSVTARAFTPKRPTLDGMVSEQYAKALAQAAQAAKLPKSWVQRLQAEAAILERIQKVGRQLKLD